jgi:hypothetical protein
VRGAQSVLAGVGWSGGAAIEYAIGWLEGPNFGLQLANRTLILIASEMGMRISEKSSAQMIIRLQRLLLLA